MFYYVDRGTQRGATYEALQLFEKYVNQQKKTGNLPVRILVENAVEIRAEHLLVLADGAVWSVIEQERRT